MTDVTKSFKPEPPPAPTENFQWYKNTVLSGHDYVAGVTRRCSNLIEANLLGAQGDRAVFSRLLTENGLLMKCEDIVDYYLDTGRFPSIAVEDDILVHGRSMNEFLQRLLDLLTECLRRRGYVVDSEHLQCELCKSLSLFIQVVNDAPVLLKQEYQWGMHFQYVRRELEWREFSDKTSRLIHGAEVANTSYVISARQPACSTVSEPISWETVTEDKIPYRNTRQRFYVHPVSRVRRVFPTVRSYLCGNSRYYTPYFFCGSLSEEQIERMLELVRESCSEPCEGFFHLMDQAAAYPQLRQVHFQLVNLLLGQITLSSFFDEAGLSLSDFALDTEKISRNFGLPNEVEPCLKALCAVRWPADILDRICAVMELGPMEEWTEESDVPPDDIRSTMELAVFLQGIHHESYAKSLERAFAAGREATAIKSTGERTFERFFSIVFGGLCIPEWEYQTTVLMLACLTQMMDWGDVSLKARDRLDENGRIWYDSSIRNTEMSLSILPRKLGPYFPRFFRLAQLSWRDDDFPIQVRNYFKRLLSDGTSQAREIIRTAEIFARVISDNPNMAGTLVNWGDIPLKDAQTQ